MTDQHSPVYGCSEYGTPWRLGWVLTGVFIAALLGRPAIFAAAPLTNAAEEQVAVYSVLAAGSELPMSPVPEGILVPAAKPAPASYWKGPLHLNLKGQPLGFRFGPAEGSAMPIRIRHRLEGLDERWRDSGGHMVLHAGFLTKSNQALGSEVREVRGESPGWSGRVDSSRFTSASIEMVVPDLADRMNIRLHCGHPTASGVWAIRNLRILQEDEEGEWKLLRRLNASPGENLHSTQGTPRDWKRTDYNWNIAKVLVLNSNNFAVALVDNDPRGGGGWGSVPTQVVPGRRLRMEWEEVYCVGQSGLGQVFYHRVPHGRYTMVVQGTDEVGIPTSPECRLAVTIVPPVYLTGWFWTGAILTAAMGTVYGVRRSARRRMELQAAQARQQQMLTEERMRIARDLHDDLGSGLTRIALLVPQALRNGAAGTPASAHLDQVSKQARELVLALDQIVWAVNPGQDTLEGLASYLCDFATDLMRDANIRFWPKVPTLLPKVQITSPTRYSLFSASKEALNNVARHSGATEVMLRFDYALDTRKLEIEVADNGCGFDPDHLARGNGLANIKSRLEKCGGEAVVERRPEGGTRVLLRLRLGELTSQGDPPLPEDAAARDSSTVAVGEAP